MITPTELFTGLRPTGGLTIANYLGSIKPFIDLMREDKSALMFVADLHGLTDQEPHTIAEYRYQIAADYIALGLDTKRADIFIQSAIAEPLLMATMLLSRHLSVAELMRVPTLKDKLKDASKPEQATVMLANYPILMAADILMQRSELVPVGEDQDSHLEIARLLARRFNAAYGNVLLEPKGQKMGGLRIMSLTGAGKMSKSKPNGAILLSEEPVSARKKVMKAETALAGEMNVVLESHFAIATALAKDDEPSLVADLHARHMSGEKVMGEFKKLLANQVERFLNEYQTRRQQVMDDEPALKAHIEQGNRRAAQNASAVVKAMQEAAGF